MTRRARCVACRGICDWYRGAVGHGRARFQVRLNVLGNLRGFTDVLGIDLVLSSIVPTIISLSSDKQWRGRESVAARMPLLAEVVGTSVFESKLLALFFSYFHDSVAAVRLSACRALEGIGSAYGGAWCSSRVMPKLSSKFGAAYLQRVTVLYACEVCSAWPWGLAGRGSSR